MSFDKTQLLANLNVIPIGIQAVHPSAKHSDDQHFSQSKKNAAGRSVHNHRFLLLVVIQLSSGAATRTTLGSTQGLTDVAIYVHFDCCPHCMRVGNLMLLSGLQHKCDVVCTLSHMSRYSTPQVDHD